MSAEFGHSAARVPGWAHSHRQGRPWGLLPPWRLMPGILRLGAESGRRRTTIGRLKSTPNGPSRPQERGALLLRQPRLAEPVETDRLEAITHRWRIQRVVCPNFAIVEKRSPVSRSASASSAAVREIARPQDSQPAGKFSGIIGQTARHGSIVCLD